MWRNQTRGRGNKYGRVKVKGLGGIWFDSQLEAAVYHRLALQERGGVIRDLKAKPGTVFLGPSRIQYRPDFSFFDSESGQLEWAEAKGFETPSWRLKLKLWRTLGPGKLHIYKGSAKSFELVETVTPRGGICPVCGK